MDDETHLIRTRNIGTMPRHTVMSETPADYDRANHNVEFSNPLFHEAGEKEPMMEEEKVKEVAGNDGDSFISFDAEDDKGYTPMAPTSDV